MVYDYIIIGSGIAGNVFAHEISKSNKTCLILEKNTTRIEKICGGGVPRKAIDLLKTIGIDISDIEPYKFSVVNGVRCTCGDQHESKTYNPDAYAIGIRRAVLDEFLLQKAIKAGANIAYGEYVRNVEEVNGIYIVNGYYAKNVVYACGARGLEEKYISGQSIAISTIIYGECSLANDFFHYFYLDKTKKKYVWAFPVGLNKPERTYKGSVAYIGNEEQISFHKYTVGDVNVVIGNNKMDSLAVINESNFFICETCGYGMVDDKTTNRFIQHSHKNPNGHDCSNDRLRRFSLGHEFQTDVAILKFIDFNLLKPDEAWTILYSLLEGLSRYLDIERNELSGCLHWFKDSNHPNGNFGFVLFDNTPGGAGYVRQLNNPDVLAGMLKAGFKVVDTCVCGEELADTACYSCLLNYYNQKQHDILKRYYAIDFYRMFNLPLSEVWPATKDENVYEIINPFQDDDESQKLQVTFCNNGRNLASDSVEEIWSDLIDECSEEEEGIVKAIREKCPQNISKPWYGESIKVVDTGEEIYTDLIWKEKKVILFISENCESYQKAKETEFTCYCLNETFDIDEFISNIEV